MSALVQSKAQLRSPKPAGQRGYHLEDFSSVAPMNQERRLSSSWGALNRDGSGSRDAGYMFSGGRDAVPRVPGIPLARWFNRNGTEGILERSSASIAPFSGDLPQHGDFRDAVQRIPTTLNRSMGLCPHKAMDWRNPVGVRVCWAHLPRVARSSQPWALGRNPLGIDPERLRFPDKVQPLPARSRIALCLAWLLASLVCSSFSVRAADTNSTAAPVDYELRVKDQPIIQRGFLPESSPRSIAVGLPGGLSYCFDAESCRLRYAWSGGFLNMKPTWHERGAAPPELRGTKFFVAPETPPLRLGDPASARPNVKFLGYALVNKLPEFRFSAGGVAVKQRIEAAPGGGLRAAFELGETKREIFFQAPKGVRVSTAGGDLASDAEGWVKIPHGSPTRFDVWIPGPSSTRPVQAATTTSTER